MSGAAAMAAADGATPLGSMWRNRIECSGSPQATAACT